jgi:hypothetical protein
MMQVRFCLPRVPLLIVVTVLIVMAVSVAWRNVYVVGSPSSEEYLVYTAFMRSLSAVHHWRPSDVALEGRTLALSRPEPESWVPAELRPFPPSKMPSEFVRCGKLCERDFMRKNLNRWSLEPAVEGQFQFEVTDSSSSSNLADKRVIALSRVGFDLWNRRAIVMYRADCRDFSSAGPAVCAESGEAFLKKTHGMWEVDQFQGISTGAFMAR